MSQYIMYRCDWCDFEDDNPSFLVEEDDEGQDLCSDCSKARADTPPPGREGQS